MSSARVRDRKGFSLLELVVVLAIMGVVAALALPRMSLASYRVDGVAQQVRSVLQRAQRTALTRQYDVIVSIDTARGELRIAADSNNSGTIEPAEERSWRPTGAADGNVFALPPRGLRTAAVASPLVGSTLRRIGGLPSIVFHRDGSASSEAELYVANGSRGHMEYRAVTLVKSTGRTDLYRLAGEGGAARWELSR